MKTTQEILNIAKQESLCEVPSASQRNQALVCMAECLVQHTSEILKANQVDMENAKGHISDVMLDRLMLNEARIQGMAKGLCDLTELPDPVGRIITEVQRPNGLTIRKVQVPFGVVAIIYESRPNVTSDAAGLLLKSGNVAVLRSGKEAWNSADAIVRAMQDGLEKAGIHKERVQLIEDRTRASSNEIMTASGYVDLLIPRGGAGLIQAVVQNATVPVIETGTGICHIYVDDSADIETALNIIENAKTSRPSVCNAEEVLLVHKDIAPTFLPLLQKRLVKDRSEHPVELRLDARAAKYIDGTPASDTDFDTEFLDYILAVGIVDSVEDAINHINAHSTHHSEAILTENEAHMNQFINRIDSTSVYVNASTRFTDGGEFGLGCEMGISTQKLHARGPMGLNELCTTKFIIRGNGQIR